MWLHQHVSTQVLTPPPRRCMSATSSRLWDCCISKQLDTNLSPLYFLVFPF